MPDVVPALLPAERRHLNDTLTELTIQVARHLCDTGLPDRHLTERDVRLAVLAAAHLLRTELDGQLDQAVMQAAKVGADYADIGAAVGMTRQGARQRWPGLARVTRAARRTGPP